MNVDELRALADDRAYLARDYPETWGGEVVAALRTAADALDQAASDRAALEAARKVTDEYGGWHLDSPEDSWRFERDIRTALGMPQYDEHDGVAHE